MDRTQLSEKSELKSNSNVKFECWRDIRILDVDVKPCGSIYAKTVEKPLFFYHLQVGSQTIFFRKNTTDMFPHCTSTNHRHDNHLDHDVSSG